MCFLKKIINWISICVFLKKLINWISICVFLKKLINWISICRTAYGISPDRNLRDRQVIPLLLLQSFTLQHQQKDKKSWPMGQVSPVVSHCENIFCNLVWNISIRFQFSHFSFPLPNVPASKKIQSQRGSFRWKFWIFEFPKLVSQIIPTEVQR